MMADKSSAANEAVPSSIKGALVQKLECSDGKNLGSTIRSDTAANAGNDDHDRSPMLDAGVEINKNPSPDHGEARFSVELHDVPMSSLRRPSSSGKFELEADEVLVQVKACAIGGMMFVVDESNWQKAPFFCGAEFSGIVRAVGTAVKLPVNQRPESWSDSLLSFATKGPAKLQSSSSTQRSLAVLRAQDEANGLRSLSVGDEVAGIVPPDSRMGGCATYTIQRLHNLVRKPALVLHEDAAAALGPGLIAYNALFSQLNIQSGDTILIHNGLSPNAFIAVQLAVLSGCKVFTSAHTASQLSYLEELANHLYRQQSISSSMGNTQKGSLSRIIDLRNESAHDVIIRETGGVGIDHILEVAQTLPTEQLLRCLAVHGKMATNSQDTNLSAGALHHLRVRGASISYISTDAWLMCPYKQGRFLHILHDLMAKLGDGTLRSRGRPGGLFPLERWREALRLAQGNGERAVHGAVPAIDCCRVVLNIS